MSAAPAKPKRRWWIRLIRWGVVSLLVLTVLLSGALWWVYTKRVTLLNNMLENAGPIQGKVGAFEVTPSGGIKMHDVVFTDRASGAVVARVPELSAQANLSKLPPDEIRSITLRNPQITLTPAMIEAWQKQAAEAKRDTRSSAPPIPFGIRFSKIDVEDGHVRFEQKDGSSAEATLSYHGENLDVQPDGITAGEMKIEDAMVRLQQADGASAEVTLNYRSEGASLRGGKLSTGEQELVIEGGKFNPKGEGAAPFAIGKAGVKGRVQEGIVDLSVVDLEKPSVNLTPELLAMFGLDLSRIGGALPADTTALSPAVPPNAPARTQGLVRGLRIEKSNIRGLSLTVSGFTGSNPSGLILPDAKGRVSYEAGGIEWKQGAPPVVAVQKVELHDFKIDAPDDGHLYLDSASFSIGGMNSKTEQVIDSLVLAKPDLRWTPRLRELLLRPSGTRQTAPDAGAPTPTARPAWLISQASVTDANVAILDTGIMPFSLYTKGALMLGNLRIDGKGLHSQSFQTLEVTEGRLVFPSSEGEALKKPWLELPHGEMVVKPDDWNERTRIARLTLDKLVVRMRDGNTPWDSSSPDDASEKQGTDDRQAGTENREPRTDMPWWKRINCGQLTVNAGQADLVLDAPKPVDMSSQVDITTQRMADGGSQHTVRLTGFTAKLPTLSPTPFAVAEAAELVGVVRLPEMWTQQRFDELHLTGGSVDMSEPLLKLFEKDKDASAASPPAAPAEDTTPPAPEPANQKSSITNQQSSSDSPWQVGHLTVKESAVTVTNLVPGMPAVKFGVSFDVKDTPLLAEDLAKDVAPQRVELHSLKIPSPNGTARYVAELDSIFVRFSLGGLMRKEIEGVEIVSPTLFVGEDLFWYVDFYRKYAERGSKPAPRGPQVAANDKAVALAAAQIVAENEPATSEASWSVKRLQVHSGKLVLAPKGIPLKGFHTPFPFHIDSELTRGTLNADMEIPSDNYELPSVDLQFIGMSGHVQFNLPLKQKDNNLVETFEVDSIRWDKITTGKATLSVTYDSAGIYSEFWVEAYGGDLNGQFNVYTDDSFHWDGWLTGKGVQTRDLTRILCPTYFMMDGEIDLTLVAQGSKDELYQADGSFKNHTPGKFSITALNDVINDLPKEWDPLKAQIAKIGLETMRDFQYDTAEMKCRFYGREGNGRFTFKGPTGTRNFDVNVFDHRWRTDDETVTVITRNDDGNDE